MSSPASDDDSDEDEQADPEFAAYGHRVEDVDPEAAEDDDDE
jgi:hypothetical protein